jgi:hypothetical protein
MQPSNRTQRTLRADPLEIPAPFVPNPFTPEDTVDLSDGVSVAFGPFMSDEDLKAELERSLWRCPQLIDAKRNGIRTPLSGRYEQEVLRPTQARDLSEALRKIQGTA